MASTIAILLTLLISFITLPHCLSSHPKPDIGFAARLLRRDSPLSPFYNPNATIRDRVKATLARSNSRLNYFQSRKSLASPDSVRSPLRPGQGEYLMQFHIGTPPVKMLAIADTGSELAWFQCLPCDLCYQMNQSPFNPMRSSTYMKITCDDPKCRRLLSAQCRQEDHICEYEEVYMDGAISRGDMSYESFTFDTERDNITFSNMVFGCGHNNSGVYGGDETGLVGLNMGSLSLVSQLFVNKFSYCMVPSNDEESGSQMLIGSEALVSSKVTPMVRVSGQETEYFLSLDGISVDTDRLPIPNGLFHADKDGNGGLLIDSGTSLTYLKREGLNILVDELAKQITNLERAEDPAEQYDLCYDATFEDLAITPDITFHFTNVDVVLTKMGSYINADDGLWCLAMLPSKSLSIFGNLAQQNYRVGYDIKNHKVSFDEVDCATF